MKKIDLFYISLSGNTDSFVRRLREELIINYDFNELNIYNIKDLKKTNSFFKIENDFIAFVPTYLEGGNGIDNGDVEILTTPFKDYLKQDNNYEHCLGIVGSGNKNFNNQYCLTAKQYSEAFNKPVIDNFELRGTNEDLDRIANKINSLI